MMHRMSSRRVATATFLIRAFLQVPVATRLDILGIYLDCYKGVNRDALHSAYISRKMLKVALANSVDSFQT